MTKPATSLLIKELELSVFLGWPDKERMQEQKVLLDIDIWFPQPPVACETDRLDDTVCYADLIEMIHQQTKNRKFHLIEYLAAEIHKMIKPLLPENSRMIVRIIKKPEIPGLNGSVQLTYWDDL